MANEEHLAILKQGVKAWNEWRWENRDVRLDLRGVDLRGADLSGAKLDGTNLRQANLGGTNLRGVDLRNADLQNANLSFANLRFANLSSAWMTGTNLSDAHLSHANLSDAKLDGAILIRANLTNVILFKTNLSLANVSMALCSETSFFEVDLSEVIGLETVNHYGRSYIDLHMLYRSQGKIPEIFLRGCGIPDNFITFLPSLTGKAIEFYSCFISYSHTDKAFAKRLHDTLQGHGIRCWLDEKQIKPGHNIASEIDRGIKYWDKTILCCSKSALTEKWWVGFEMKKALAKEQDLMRERGQHVRAIIPLDLDGYLLGEYAGEYRSEIMSRSVANFKGYESDISIFDREIERVIAALRTDEGREIPPKPLL